MWRWRKRSPPCGPKNISRNAFAALTGRKPCGFWTKLEREILQGGATNFPRIGKSQEKPANRSERQFPDRASLRNRWKELDAAKLRSLFLRRTKTQRWMLPRQ